MRSYAREVAFCKVYSFIITGEFDEDFSMFDAEKLTDEDVNFAKKLLFGVVENKARLDQIVADFSRSFKLERIYRPDLAALDLALFEMIYCDTPHPVAISEAVGIAKKIFHRKERLLCQRHFGGLRTVFVNLFVADERSVSHRFSRTAPFTNCHAEPQPPLLRVEEFYPSGSSF